MKALLLILLIALPRASTSDQTAIRPAWIDPTASKRQAEFAQIYTLAAKPWLEQREEIEVLYKTSPLITFWGLWGDTPLWLPDLDKNKPFEASLYIVERGQGSSETLGKYAQKKLLEVFSAHADILYPLIRADLRGSDPQNAYRALELVRQMSEQDKSATYRHFGFHSQARVAERWRALGPDCFRWLNCSDRLDTSARQAIDRINDPRYIDDLLAIPNSITKYTDTLATIQAYRPPNPAILAATKSGDPKVRAAAVTILTRAEESWRVANAESYLNDPAPEVRMAACWIVYSLGDKQHERTMATLKRMLQDPDKRVRLTYATLLAYREDLIAAPVLADLYLDTELSDSDHGSVKQAID